MISDAARRVNRVLWIYTFLVLSITGMSWVVYKRHNIFYARPLFAQNDRYRDLTNYIGKTAHLLGGASTLGHGMPVFTYPAPAAFVYKALLYTVPGHAARTFLVFLGVCSVGFAVAAWRASNAGARNWIGKLTIGAAIAVTALLGYPTWFTADRGNIEGVVWAISCAGLCFLLRARYKTAAILIGTAVAIKPFPFLFLLMLLRRRRYKEAALALATMVLITLVSLTALGPNPLKAYQELKPGVGLYAARYVTNLSPMDEERFDHSLLDGMKSVALIVKTGSLRPKRIVAEQLKLTEEPGGWHIAGRLAHIYPIFVIAGLGLLIAVFYKMPILNQVTALGVAVTLFPLSAGEYTLLHLYLPFGVFLVFLTREVATGKVTFPYRAALTLAVLYALLLTPLTFLAIYASDAKLLLLIALLFVVARSPMDSEYFKDEGAGNNLSAGQRRIELSPVAQIAGVGVARPILQPE